MYRGRVASSPSLRRSFFTKARTERGVPREWIRDYAAHQIFANLYYDFPNESPWTPYVGGGLGVAITTLNYANQFIRKPSTCASTSSRTGRTPPSAPRRAPSAPSIRRFVKKRLGSRCSPAPTTC